MSLRRGYVYGEDVATNLLVLHSKQYCMRRNVPVVPRYAHYLKNALIPTPKKGAPQ